MSQMNVMQRAAAIGRLQEMAERLPDGSFDRVAVNAAVWMKCGGWWKLTKLRNCSGPQKEMIQMKVRKRLPENGFRDVRNLTLGREVLVHRFTPCYRDDWRPRIPDKGVLEAVDPKGCWALVRFTVACGSYLECFFPSEILKIG